MPLKVYMKKIHFKSMLHSRIIDFPDAQVNLDVIKSVFNLLEKEQKITDLNLKIITFLYNFVAGEGVGVLKRSISYPATNEIQISMIIGIPTSGSVVWGVPQKNVLYSGIKRENFYNYSVPAENFKSRDDYLSACANVIQSHFLKVGIKHKGEYIVEPTPMPD